MGGGGSSEPDIKSENKCQRENLHYNLLSLIQFPGEPLFAGVACLGPLNVEPLPVLPILDGELVHLAGHQFHVAFEPLQLDVL